MSRIESTTWMVAMMMSGRPGRRGVAWSGLVSSGLVSSGWVSSGLTGLE